MRRLICACLAALCAATASQAGDSTPIPSPSASTEAVSFFTAAGDMAARLVLGEVEFRGQGSSLSVHAYQLIGQTACHPYTPDTPRPSKLTDAFKPTTTACPAAGPWLGFADTVRHITVEFDLGDVAAVEAFELTYLCNALPAARPDRVRFFASLDGTFPGQGWGANSDSDLPVPQGSYYDGDFPAAGSVAAAGRALLLLPRPVRARYVRLVFSYDMALNLVRSDSGRSDLSDLCTTSYPLWPMTGQAEGLQNFGSCRPDTPDRQTGWDRFHSSRSSPSSPWPHWPSCPVPPKITPGGTTTVPEPATMALLALSALALLPRRRPDKRR